MSDSDDSIPFVDLENLPYDEDEVNFTFTPSISHKKTFFFVFLAD